MDELDPKTDGFSLDIVADNVDKMRQLFPDVFTEGRVDFDALHDVLGDYIDDRQERYTLSWHGKATARRIAQTPSNGSLRPFPQESIRWDATQNLFIEGDNLEILKLLQKSYYGRVKVIYIDPPYNTGGEFVYPDKYQDSLETYLRYTGQVDGEGLKLSANTEGSGRYHTNWLNMMYPRLKAARNLLREDGVIFISIDDNEQPRLRLLCDEVFGEENFIATLVHQRAKGGGQAKYVVKGHDYVLVYARDLSCGDVALRREKVVQGRTMEKDGRTYLLNDDVVRKKFGKYDKGDGDRRCSYEELLEYKGEEKKAEIDAKLATGDLFLQKDKDGRHIICRLELLEEASSKMYSIIKVLSEEGKKELDDLGVRGFDYPKPSELVKTLVKSVAFSSDDDAIVLDFFAGSGTTGDAVLRLNAEDGGRRRFICVQLPEPCELGSEASLAGYTSIADIGKDRIRRVINKIEQDDSAHSDDLGFRVFKLSDSNIAHWSVDGGDLEQALLLARDAFRDDRTEDDVLFEVLLKYGLPLTSSVERKNLLGVDMFWVADGAVVVCLGGPVTGRIAGEMVTSMRESPNEVTRVVFADRSFAGDVDKTNVLQVLRRAGIDDVKCI